MKAIIEEKKLKVLIKEAINEVFEENREMFYELFAEVIEDIAFVNAIKEGEKTKSVSRDEIFKVLES